MTDTSVIVNSKSDCPYCTQVKEWLAGKGIPFTEVKYDDERERQLFYDLEGLTGADRTVPQVVLLDSGQRYRIGGARATMRSGIQSLFPQAEHARGAG